MYFRSVMRILPRHLRDLINIADIAAVHSGLEGTSPMSANVAFLDILHLWPLYGATFYKVTVSIISSLFLFHNLFGTYD